MNHKNVNIHSIFITWPYAKLVFLAAQETGSLQILNSRGSFLSGYPIHITDLTRELSSKSLTSDSGVSTDVLAQTKGGPLIPDEISHTKK